jgi:hypothetical protein
MLKFHRELLRRLREEGISVTDVEQRRNSVILYCEKEGRAYRYYAGISPSDWRALDNAFHDIVRGLRGKEGANDEAKANA